MRERGRQNLMLMATLRIAGGAACPVRVRDISKGGLKIEAPLGAPNGTPVRIELPNLGWRDGTIAWTQPGKLGIRLNTEIEPNAVRQPVSGTYAQLPTMDQPHLRRIL